MSELPKFYVDAEPLMTEDEALVALAEAVLAGETVRAADRVNAQTLAREVLRLNDISELPAVSVDGREGDQPEDRGSQRSALSRGKGEKA